MLFSIFLLGLTVSLRVEKIQKWRVGGLIVLMDYLLSLSK